MKRALTPTDIVIRDEILKRLEAGQSLREICRESWAPSETLVRRWARDEDEFGAQYLRARKLGYDRLAEELLEVTRNVRPGVVKRVVRKYVEKDGELVEGSEEVEETETESDAVDRARLHSDALKWTLSKMLPKVYGDKLAVESSGPDGGPIQHEVQAVHSIDPVAASQVYQKFMEGGG